MTFLEFTRDRIEFHRKRIERLEAGTETEIPTWSNTTREIFYSQEIFRAHETARAKYIHEMGPALAYGQGKGKPG